MGRKVKAGQPGQAVLRNEDAVGVGDCDGEGELVGVGEGLTVDENEAPVLQEAVLLPVGEREDEDVGVRVRVTEGVGVRVRVTEGVSESDVGATVTTFLTPCLPWSTT